MPDPDETKAESGREVRRAPVQGIRDRRGHVVKPAGTVEWSEHVEAWHAYAKRYGTQQSAQRIAERHGFDYEELVEFLGREPTTWRPRD